MNNIACNHFEFSSDRIAEKAPRELGAYIAGMAGDDEALEVFAGFVDALKCYNKADGEAFQSGIFDARARRRR